jgi:hypothetical protein
MDGCSAGAAPERGSRRAPRLPSVYCSRLPNLCLLPGLRAALRPCCSLPQQPAGPHLPGRVPTCPRRAAADLNPLVPTCPRGLRPVCCVYGRVCEQARPSPYHCVIRPQVHLPSRPPPFRLLTPSLCVRAPLLPIHTRNPCARERGRRQLAACAGSSSAPARAAPSSHLGGLCPSASLLWRQRPPHCRPAWLSPTLEARAPQLHGSCTLAAAPTSQ